MDKFLFALGYALCILAAVIAWVYPAMQAWVFVAMLGAGVLMVGAGD